MNTKDFSREYIEQICELYGDYYDDRVEDTHPPTTGGEWCSPGEDWCPGMTANHKSLLAFQRELKGMGITLSTSKIKKILITGGRWTTQRSRSVQEAFARYTCPSLALQNGKRMSEAEAIRRISVEMEISIVSVSVNLPYCNVVYNLEQKSSNAKRCAKYKEKLRNRDNIGCGRLGK